MEDSLMVLGPLALVALALLGYLVYLWLQYYEDSSRMESREAQYHQQSKANLAASDRARARTGQVLAHCQALEGEIAALRQQVSQLRQAGSGDHE